MASADQVIEIPRLRNSIGVVGDDSDTKLIAYRSAAIGVVEQMVSRHILDKTGWRNDSADFYYSTIPDRLIFRVPDIKSGTLVLHYADHGDDPKGATDQTMDIDTSSTSVLLDRDYLSIYSTTTAWGDILRLSHPTPYIVANVGIDVDDIPDAWREAVSLIVRAIYDGSAYDDIGEMSALKILLYPWKVSAYMSSVR